MSKNAPKALKIWFTIHFIADVIFALPLMIFPVKFLTLLGWQSIDPISARLVAAALFGIGIESFLGRNASVDSFKSMLNLKIIWSLTAVIGIGWSLLEGAHNGPFFGWSILGIFIVFNGLWIFWRIRLEKL